MRVVPYWAKEHTGPLPRHSRKAPAGPSRPGRDPSVHFDLSNRKWKSRNEIDFQSLQSLFLQVNRVPVFFTEKIHLRQMKPNSREAWFSVFFSCNFTFIKAGQVQMLYIKNIRIRTRNVTSSGPRPSGRRSPEARSPLNVQRAVCRPHVADADQ